MRPFALMHNGFASFEQPSEAYFSTFARATHMLSDKFLYLALEGAYPLCSYYTLKQY